MGRHLKPLPMDEIAAEYLSGKSLRPLGLKYGVPKSTIGRRLKQYGIELRPPGYPGPGNRPVVVPTTSGR